MRNVMITGEMWNNITAIQDRLVLLHNGLEDKPFRLSWSVSPGIGAFYCDLYSLREDGTTHEHIDGCKCYVDCEFDGSTVNDVMNKITEWEAKYALD